MSYLAEKEIIGALLIDQGRMDDVYNILSADMFTSEILGRCYLEFQRGYDNRYDVNVATLVQKISSDSMPENIVLEEIKSCIADTVISSEIKTNANVVANEYKAKQLSDVLNRIRICPDDIDRQIGQIISELELLREGKSTASSTLPEIVNKYKGYYFVDRESEKTYTGFLKLDGLLGGFEGGDMIAIGARPGVGKSALITQIAENLAEQGKRVGFYNLEMSEKQIYERFIVAHSGIGLTRLRQALRFIGGEKEQFDRANEILVERDNIIITTGSRSVSDIRSESRHMGYDIIIIDYLQLLKADRMYGNRYAEVGAISKSIKALAMELNIPIIALSQLNRASEMRSMKEPTMAEMRDAGDIEQDASVVILLWNLSQENRSVKGCKVEKNRQGRTGKVVLKFNGDLMRFEETDGSVENAPEWEDAAGQTPFD